MSISQLRSEYQRGELSEQSAAQDAIEQFSRTPPNAEVLDALSQKGAEQDAPAEASVREKVRRLVSRFPIYEG